MITLIQGEKLESGARIPSLYADHVVIEQMFEEGVFTIGDIPPSHVTIVDSPFYGHKISYSEEPDGCNIKQVLKLTAVRDEIWIAQQVERRRVSNNRPVAGEVLEAGADALQTYAILDMAGDVVEAVGSAIAKGAGAVGECVGDIVSGICD